MNYLNDKINLEYLIIYQFKVFNWIIFV